MPRLLRVPRKAALVLAVLAAALAVPASATAASARPAAGQGATATPVVRSTVARSTGGTVLGAPFRTVALTSATSAGTASGGLCGVPGIGDIGGLFGFCAAGSSGLTGDLNNICSPALPDPEPANSGIDALVAPPKSTGPQPQTLYSQDGVAGDYWAATNLQCSDMTSLIGNNVAGMVFDAAKSLDRVTITVYQSAAGEGILTWLSNVTDRLITALGNAIYFPYVAVVVILGAIWLAWQGLIRKRGTRTIEGTVWMVVACAAAIFLIGKPGDLTGLGKGVSDGITQTLNVAFAKLPSPGPSNCVPLQKGDPQAQPTSYAYTSGSTVVDQNASELWTVLVCKPWLDGELGTANYSPPGAKPTVVNTYGRQLLWAQTIAMNEKPTAALIQAKQATYAGIASSIEHSDPAVYPLFQGNEWTTRLEIAFAALFAAVVAGVLILLISVTLILLKLGFLLLLIVGPFFLLIGTHPGFGRVVALRWVEMLIGVLLKQAAVALVLSVLLYCYALIMGTSDAVLPWALKILMIALVTGAAFVYRKPFQHLFSAVGYGVIGSRDRADADLQRAGSTFRGNTVTAATLAVPGIAAYRAARWARRNPAQAAGLALSATSAAGMAGGGMAGAGMAAGDGSGAEAPEAYPVADDPAVAVAAATAGDGSAGRTAAARGRARAASGSDDGTGRQAPPPLNLPSRNGAVAPPPAATRYGGAAVGSVPATRTAPDLPAATARPAALARPAAAAGSAAPAAPAASGPVPMGGGGIWPGRPATRQPAPPAAAGSGPAASGPPAPPSSLFRPASAPRPSAPRPSAPRPSAPRQSAQGQGAQGQGAPARQPAPSRQAPPAAPSAPAAPAPAPRQEAPASRPAPPRQAAPARSPGPAPRRAGRTPLRGSGAPPARGGAPSQGRPASPPPASPPPASPPGSEGEAGRGGPLSGRHSAEEPGPFWLRPLRRHK
jgi:hypothetical protein